VNPRTGTRLSTTAGVVGLTSVVVAFGGYLVGIDGASDTTV
jgi:hypothetical protein